MSDPSCESALHLVEQPQEFRGSRLERVISQDAAALQSPRERCKWIPSCGSVCPGGPEKQSLKLNLQVFNCSRSTACAPVLK